MSAAPGRPGRPRSAGADRAILDATLACLCDEGFEGATIEAVARRAGVGRPTIYRRYRDRIALIEDAVRDCFERDVPTVAPAGDALAEVHELLANTIDMLKRTQIGPLFRAVIPHLPHHPTLGRLANDLGRRRRTRLRAALERAVEEGALATDRDLDALIDGVLGAIYFRYFVTGRRLDRRYAVELLASLA